jgi:hypothetical protein
MSTGTAEAILQILILQRIHAEPEGTHSRPPAYHLPVNTLRQMNGPQSLVPRRL